MRQYNAIQSANVAYNFICMQCKSKEKQIVQSHADKIQSKGNAHVKQM